MFIGKVFLYFSLLISVIAAPTKRSEAPFKFNIYSHNIRVANNNEEKGELPWAKRKNLLIESIKNHTSDAPSLVGLQEVLNGPLDDILSGLGGTWTHFGVGRDDGKKAGEYSPVLYQNDTWELKKGKEYWLSPTPDVPSRGWDAKYNRIVTVVTLEHKKSKNKIHYLNTHLDDSGSTARLNSAKEIISIIGNFSKKHELPVFLSGDFNSQPTDDAYKTIAKNLTDSSSNKSLDTGFTETWTGFNHEKPGLIDFIFYKNRTNINVLAHTVLPNNITDVMISDHRPVLTEFTIGEE